MRCTRSFAILLVALFVAGHVPRSWAHCDSLSGPVVMDARTALEKGDVTPVLKWVKKEHELEIRNVFEQTMTVRAMGEDAKKLADMYFFETLVRIHRAGEGEAYTGLKPAESIDPGIQAADDALRSGSGDELAGDLSTRVGAGIRERLKLARERSEHAAESIDAGREYVEAYVDYIHYVENVHRLVTHGVAHLHHEPAPGIE